MPIQCDISHQKVSIFSKLVTELMNNVFEDLIGNNKLCNTDTTDIGDGDKVTDDKDIISEQEHDFFLI